MMVNSGLSGGLYYMYIYIYGWWCNNHIEKYEFVNGKDDIPYMKWIEMEHKNV